jgi:hypothetical protein
VAGGALAPRDAAARLAPLMPAAACDGDWHGKPGIVSQGARVPESVAG